MTRFERELSGALGAFWKEHAEKEIRKMEEEVMSGELFFRADGVALWKTSGNVIPDNVVEILKHSAYRELFDEEATTRAKEEQDAEAIASYKRRMQNHKYSQEEMAEMRAAFGEGTEVVDIITGRTVRL